MKLSTKGRYAVMAMADMASQAAGKLDENPVSLYAISERQGISLSYLEQLYNRLRKAGLVKSVRGPKGGYLLARNPSRIRVSEIMIAVAEPVSAVRCGNDDGHGCMGDERCITHDLWQELDRQILAFLNSVSLKDVIDGTSKDSPVDLTVLAAQAAGI